MHYHMIKNIPMYLHNEENNVVTKCDLFINDDIFLFPV